MAGRQCQSAHESASEREGVDERLRHWNRGLAGEFENCLSGHALTLLLPLLQPPTPTPKLSDGLERGRRGVEILKRDWKGGEGESEVEEWGQR